MLSVFVTAEYIFLPRRGNSTSEEACRESYPDKVSDHRQRRLVRVVEIVYQQSRGLTGAHGRKGMRHVALQPGVLGHDGRSEFPVGGHLGQKRCDAGSRSDDRL